MELSDFYDSFFEEADELLEDMEKHLLELDLNEPDSEQLNAIFRAAHSIKGGAGAFGFTVLQETTHLLENLLDYARHGQLVLRRDIIDVFLESKDILSAQIHAYRSGVEPDADAFARVSDALKTLAEQEVDGSDVTTDKHSAKAIDLARSAEQDPLVSGAATVQENANDAPLQRISKTLQRIARRALGQSDTPQLSAQTQEADVLTRLSVNFLSVPETDRQLLLEELAHLGTVVSSNGDDSKFEVLLDSTEEADAIEAVMCFIIEAEQLEIRPLDAPLSVAHQAPQSGAAAPTNTTPKRAQQAASKAVKSKDDTQAASIRVSVDKVDQIINLVGELIIAQSMLDQTAENLQISGKGELVSGLSQLQRTARDLQESVMSIRMLPMDFVFSRYPRLVRDLAAKLGKEIELVTEGKSTELDKGLIESIIDPLTHLVRNSLDHGIETPDVREAAGKARTGRLSLSARHMGGSILIEVADDGGGLNREKLLAKARSNGLDVSDEMSNDEVWQLIFAPGFSTAEVVSDVSGRGVGMDVVKRNIQSLGGYVEILSTPGQGTTTRVVLPLTLAILDGMSLRVGEEMFVLPLSAVAELVQPTEADLFTMAGGDVLLKVRDEYLPVLALHEVMNVPGARTRMTDAIALIVYYDESSYALLVDEPVGQQQVVVKNLETNYRRVPGVSAATILGDGRVALILDPVGLHRFAHAKGKNRTSHKATKSQDYREVLPS